MHESLGHTAHKTIGDQIRQDRINLPAVAFNGMEHSWSACNQCKQELLPIPKVSNRVTEVMELVHTDLCGPFKLGHKGERYLFCNSACGACGACGAQLFL